MPNFECCFRVPKVFPNFQPIVLNQFKRKVQEAKFTNYQEVQ